MLKKDSPPQYVFQLNKIARVLTNESVAVSNVQMINGFTTSDGKSTISKKIMGLSYISWILFLAASLHCVSKPCNWTVSFFFYRHSFKAILARIRHFWCSSLPTHFWSLPRNPLLHAHLWYSLWPPFLMLPLLNCTPKPHRGLAFFLYGPICLPSYSSNLGVIRHLWCASPTYSLNVHFWNSLWPAFFMQRSLDCTPKPCWWSAIFLYRPICPPSSYFLLLLHSTVVTPEIWVNSKIGGCTCVQRWDPHIIKKYKRSH